jgi:hypothetical protein
MIDKKFTIGQYALEFLGLDPKKRYEVEIRDCSIKKKNDEDKFVIYEEDYIGDGYVSIKFDERGNEILWESFYRCNDEQLRKSDWWSHEYDSRGNMIKYDCAEDLCVPYTCEYDENNNLILTKRQDGGWEKRFYNSDNKLMHTLDHTGRVEFTKRKLAELLQLDLDKFGLI